MTDKTHKIWLYLLILSGLMLNANAFAQATSVTVIDFYNLSQNKNWDWLSRGLADMLITDLAAVDRFQVVDREALQNYLEEIELQESGHFKEQSLIKIGRLTGVEKVIFGTYHVDKDEKIQIQATIVDVATQKIDKVAGISGAINQVLNLEKELASSLLREFGISLSNQEMQRFQFKWTNSLDAAAHFYTALEHYDNGELPLALAETKFAERIDPDYVPARFWAGRLYIELAEYAHAEEYLSNFLKDARQREYQQSYSVHVAFLLAQLYDKFLEQPEKAILILHALKRDKPDSFEQANIHFQLASLYQLTGKYHQAYDLFVSLYKYIDSFGCSLSSDKCINDPKKLQFNIPYRSVHLMPSIYQIQKMALENYQSSFLLAYYSTETKPEPQKEMFLLSPESPEYERLEVIQKNFSYADTEEKPMFYAPKGKRFKAFTFKFKGKQKTISIHPVLHLNQLFNQTGQKQNMPAPKGGVSKIRYETHQEMVQAFFFNAYVNYQPEGKFNWKIKAEFIPVNASQPGSIKYWHDLLKNNVEYPLLFDTPDHIGEKTALLEDDKGGIWAIYDTKDKEEKNDRGKDSDFWLVYSSDKKHWNNPRRLTAVNSIANDFDPVLFQDGRKRYVLVFVSNRRGKNQLWLSTSQDGKKWQRPNRIRLKQENKKIDLDQLVTPKVFQDSNGIYHLAAFHTEKQKVVLSSSKDLRNWEQPIFVNLPNMEPVIGWGEKVSLDYLEDNNGVYRLIISPDFYYKNTLYLGSSINAKNWDIKKAPFEGDSQPSVIHGRNGEFALMLASAINPKSSEYQIHYAFQFSSKDWETWSAAKQLPRIHYLADGHMKPTEIMQDSEGYYWLANHQHFKGQFQLYRLKSFPAKNITETFPAKAEAQRYARIQLKREALREKATNEGKDNLAKCLRFAMNYQRCYQGQLKDIVKKEWWLW